MIPIARSRYSFYRTIDVEHSTYEDLKVKLTQDKVSVDKYTVVDFEGRDVLVFGSIGFRSKINESSDSRLKVD